MAAPREAAERFRSVDEPCAEWVAVDVENQTEQVAIIVHEARPVSVLEEMTNAIMAAVESAGVTGTEPRHQPRERDGPRLNGEVHVIRHQDPSETAESEFWNEEAEAR